MVGRFWSPANSNERAAARCGDAPLGQVPMHDGKFPEFIQLKISGVYVFETKTFVVRWYRFGRILSIQYGTVYKTRCLIYFNGGNDTQDGPVLCKGYIIDSMSGTF